MASKGLIRVLQHRAIKRSDCHGMDDCLGENGRREMGDGKVVFVQLASGRASPEGPLGAFDGRGAGDFAGYPRD